MRPCRPYETLRDLVRPCETLLDLVRPCERARSRFHFCCQIRRSPKNLLLQELVLVLKEWIRASNVPNSGQPESFRPRLGRTILRDLCTKWIRHNGCLCRMDGLCKRVSCGFVYQGLSTEMHHGDVLLMTGNFQREFMHCTVPATEWSTTWATAAQQCTLVPTRVFPRINLTGRFIRNHQCDMNPRIPSLLPLPPPPEQAPADAHSELTSVLGPVVHN